MAEDDKDQDVKLFKKTYTRRKTLRPRRIHRKAGKNDGQNLKAPKSGEKEEEISDVSPEYGPRNMALWVCGYEFRKDRRGTFSF